MKKAEAVVLGAGPGGYVAAIRLGQLGKRTILVEKDELGGVCLNIGCIPSKALIRLARLKRRIEEGGPLGIEAGDLKVDVSKVQAWKRGVVEKLRAGVAYLCKQNNVEVLKGTGTFESPRKIRVTSGATMETVEFDDAIIATGSRSLQLPNLPFDGRTIISSTEALELDTVPRNFVVVGGGVTGLEIATLYAQLGSKVTVIELLDQLLTGIDLELVRVVERALRKLGVQTYTSARTKSFINGKIRFQKSNGEDGGVEADKVLVSVGRDPNSDEIGLETTGVQVDAKRFIPVDKQRRTNVPNIFAIGDVVGPPMLAHKASKEGVVAAEVIAGINSAADFRAIANVVFTDPEIATVGLTEDQAKAKGYDPVVGRFPFTALGRAVLANEMEGLVKIVADRNNDLVLGVHIVGSEAADIISEAALAIEMGATVEDVGFTIHPHPTLPEAIMEAAEAAKGKAIHIARA